MGWWNKKKEPKIKEFTFGVEELVCSGDKYEYKVKASSKREAFNILVKYFFGEDNHKIDKAVVTKEYQVTQPGKNSFTYWGMPRWFAERISGRVRNGRSNYQDKLEQHARKHGIILK